MGILWWVVVVCVVFNVSGSCWRIVWLRDWVLCFRIVGWIWLDWWVWDWVWVLCWRLDLLVCVVCCVCCWLWFFLVLVWFFCVVVYDWFLLWCVWMWRMILVGVWKKFWRCVKVVIGGVFEDYFRSCRLWWVWCWVECWVRLRCDWCLIGDIFCWVGYWCWVGFFNVCWFGRLCLYLWVCGLEVRSLVVCGLFGLVCLWRWCCWCCCWGVCWDNWCLY